MKTEETAFKELHLPMLSSTGHTLVFGDELLLTDNIGIRIDTESVADFVSPTYPFKVTFTLVMFCRRGRMRVSLNLREYCIADNDVLVVLPGSIGECLEMDSQTEVMVIGFAGFHFIGNYKSAQSMAFRRFFTSTSLMHISSEEMEESVMLYRLMWDKLNEPDYEFKCEVLGGYLQVLFYNGCQWMKKASTATAAEGGKPSAEIVRRLSGTGSEILYRTAQYSLLCREAVSDAQISVSGDIEGKRPFGKRLDKGLCDSGGKSLIEEWMLHGSAGGRYAEFLECFVFWQIF